MAIVYLGIGSNVGDRRKNIDTAMGLLKSTGINILRCSSIIQTAPVGGPPNQNNFFNGVIKASTNLSPQDLLSKLKTIESLLGRVPTVRNGPRTIDLDILLYDQLELKTPLLSIPHPRMFERDFVIHPLKEIEPQLVEKLTHARH